MDHAADACLGTRVCGVIRDAVGPYLDPPEKALVLRVYGEPDPGPLRAAPATTVSVGRRPTTLPEARADDDPLVRDSALGALKDAGPNDARTDVLRKLTQDPCLGRAACRVLAPWGRSPDA
ncbi:hypothetical protein OH786_19730 [Streptomyces atratus]|uniref:HEAT repeat-containing protein n=1 Tax=Streptomyces atratus TaxID=1893 RepID=A0A1K2ER47_STRAR|nr:hypothetical protein [Streptomyces atratus]SFY37269.1 hypothetical protein SAMN02787144_102119 [Streptomyces atratus]